MQLPIGYVSEKLGSTQPRGSSQRFRSLAAGQHSTPTENLAAMVYYPRVRRIPGPLAAPGVDRGWRDDADGVRRRH